MKKLALVLFLIVLVLALAAAASDARTRTVKWQGQMVCMWHDVILQESPERKGEEHQCSPAFTTKDGTVYTLVGNKVGKELGDIAMHEQKVEIRGHLLPKSHVIEVKDYRVIQRVKVRTPENPNDWWNF